MNGELNRKHYLPRWGGLLNQKERLAYTVLRVTEGFLVLFLLSICFAAELVTPEGRLVWSYDISMLQHYFVHMKDFLTRVLTMKWQGKSDLNVTMFLMNVSHLPSCTLGSVGGVWPLFYRRS